MVTHIIKHLYLIIALLQEPLNMNHEKKTATEKDLKKAFAAVADRVVEAHDFQAVSQDMSREMASLFTPEEIAYMQSDITPALEQAKKKAVADGVVATANMYAYPDEGGKGFFFKMSDMKEFEDKVLSPFRSAFFKANTDSRDLRGKANYGMVRFLEKVAKMKDYKNDVTLSR